MPLFSSDRSGEIGAKMKLVAPGNGTRTSRMTMTSVGAIVLASRGPHALSRGRSTRFLMLNIDHITKRFGAITALDDV